MGTHLIVLRFSDVGNHRWETTMLGLWNAFVTSLRDDKGAALAEWGLLVVLIAIVALIALTAMGAEVSETYSDISSTLVEAGN